MRLRRCVCLLGAWRCALSVEQRVDVCADVYGIYARMGRLRTAQNGGAWSSFVRSRSGFRLGTRAEA